MKNYICSAKILIWEEVLLTLWVYHKQENTIFYLLNVFVAQFCLPKTNIFDQVFAQNLGKKQKKIMTKPNSDAETLLKGFFHKPPLRHLTLSIQLRN